MSRLGSLSLISLLAVGLPACGGSGEEMTEGTPSSGDPSGIPTTSLGMTTDPGTTATDDPTQGSGGTDSSTGDTTEGPTTTSDPTTTTESDTDTDDTQGMTTGPDACTPADCAVGQYCNVDTGVCEPGCDEDEDCNNDTVCNVEENVCTGCVSDGDCALGTVCEAGTCVPGCNEQQPCQNGFTCCEDSCADLLNDPLQCGGCGMACDPIPNAETLCAEGECIMGMCDDGFNDCDQNPNNGCETEGACACTPGEMQSCYTGFPPTENVGECKSGTQVCNDEGTQFGPCEGEVLPIDEVCANNADDNCDGVVDEDPDFDNDGYTVCGGDCCDQVGEVCQQPELVNPGAFEVAGNEVDDDCDGIDDNVVQLCDNGLPSNAGNPLDYARAIDLCQFTTENPPPQDRVWGVISGAFNRANGSGNPSSNARSIRNGFGNNIPPEYGQRLAVLSSGHAADTNDNNPNYSPFEIGTSLGTNSPAPADWLAANGGQFPNAPGCPGAAGTTANDSIQLRLRVRVPTNANSFSVKMFFFSAEYPEWVCSSFNDLFVTLVDSNDNDNPNDKNIAIYVENNNQWPVGVNLVSAAPGLFSVCDNGTIGCSGGNQSNYNGCSQGEAQLTGTGFDLNASACSGNDDVGGGTGWLTMSGNVVPGETMEIRFVIWDTGDGIYDSLVLLDEWQWSVQASEPGVTPG